MGSQSVLHLPRQLLLQVHCYDYGNLELFKGCTKFGSAQDSVNVLYYLNTCTRKSHRKNKDKIFKMICKQKLHSTTGVFYCGLWATLTKDVCFNFIVIARNSINTLFSYSLGSSNFL